MNITLAEVVTSTILFGIVHAIWTGIKWIMKHLETEAGQIINAHVKGEHSARLKDCLEGHCPKLETEPDSPRLA